MAGVGHESRADARSVNPSWPRRRLPHGLDDCLDRQGHRHRALTRPDPLVGAGTDPGHGRRARRAQCLGAGALLRPREPPVPHCLGDGDPGPVPRDRVDGAADVEGAGGSAPLLRDHEGLRHLLTHAVVLRRRVRRHRWRDGEGRQPVRPGHEGRAVLPGDAQPARRVRAVRRGTVERGITVLHGPAHRRSVDHARGRLVVRVLRRVHARTLRGGAHEGLRDVRAVSRLLHTPRGMRHGSAFMAPESVLAGLRALDSVPPR